MAKQTESAAPPPRDSSKSAKEPPRGWRPLLPQPWWLLALTILLANYVLTRLLSPEATEITASAKRP